MENESIKTKLEEFVTNSTDLGETAYKLAKINAITKVTSTSASFLFTIISSVFFLFILLFASTAIAFWLGEKFDSTTTGFLLVAGFYLVLFILFMLLKGKLILPWLRKKLVQKIYE